MSTFGNSLKDTYPYIKRAAMILTGYNKPDADDLVQKAFLRALEKQHLCSHDNVVGWVLTIMKNIFLDDIRRNKGKHFVDIDNEILISKDNDIIEIDDINLALGKLEKKCRNILALMAKEYKYKEISEQLMIPIGTVMSRLSRCREQLFRELYD